MEAISNSEQITLLITGSKGQLGSEFLAFANNFDNLKFIYTDVDNLDITSSEELSFFISKSRPNYIINCAGYTAVDKAEIDQANAFKLNAEAPKLLALKAKEFGAKLIHISTDYVFDGKSWEPYTELSPTSPNSVYGESKLRGEEAVINSGIGMVIRTSWLYSVHGHNFVKTIALKGQNSNTLKVVFDQVGSPTWARDLAMAIVSIVKKGENHFTPEIFHYSNEGVCSWFDFAKEIVDYFQYSCEVLPILSSEFPTQVIRPPYSVLNKQKIKSTFGISVPYWRQSLRNCLDKLVL